MSIASRTWRPPPSALKGVTPKSDWRTWNLGRTQARQVVQENIAGLRAAACPAKDKKD